MQEMASLICPCRWFLTGKRVELPAPTSGAVDQQGSRQYSAVVTPGFALYQTSAHKCHATKDVTDTGKEEKVGGSYRFHGSLHVCTAKFLLGWRALCRHSMGQVSIAEQRMSDLGGGFYISPPTSFLILFASPLSSLCTFQ